MMILKLLTVALIGSSVIVSAPPDAGQPAYPAYTRKVTLTWWDWGTNDQAVAKLFEKQYPNIHVIARNVGDGTPHYTKLSTAIKAGTGAPDVVQVEFDKIPQYVATGGLRDLAPLGAARYRPFFQPRIWNQVNRGKAVYAIPVDSGATALFYNSKLFSRYGLGIPTTWDAFLADAAKLHAADPHLYMSWIDPADGGWFLSLAWAAGARPFHQTGSKSWRINIASPQALKVATLWDQMFQKGYVQPIGTWTPDWAKALARGRYATFVGAAWSPSYELAPYLKPGSGWKAAPLPQWSGNSFATGDWGGSTYAVTTQSKHPEAALLFAAWLSTSEQGIRWNVLPADKGGRGVWPMANLSFSNRRLLNQPVAILDGQRVGTLFANAARAVGTGFQWSPWTTYFDNRYAAEASKAVQGRETWNQALTNVQASVSQFAKQHGVTVTP
jgi:multiple sugar transport system substrate-binding protein